MRRRPRIQQPARTSVSMTTCVRRRRSITVRQCRVEGLPFVVTDVDEGELLGVQTWPRLPQSLVIHRVQTEMRLLGLDDGHATSVRTSAHWSRPPIIWRARSAHSAVDLVGSHEVIAGADACIVDVDRGRTAAVVLQSERVRCRLLYSLLGRIWAGVHLVQARVGVAWSVLADELDHAGVELRGMAGEHVVAGARDV